MSEINTPEKPKNVQGSSRMLKASGVTGMMTMVSRVLGLARDITIARLFGTSDGADAFFLAFKIPNFLRRLFAEGAFNQAFVPVLSEYRSTKSLEDVQKLLSRVAGSLGMTLILITALVVVAAPYIAIPMAYGYTDEPEKFAVFVQMFRLNFPYLLLISLTALCSSVLNCYDKFAVPALTPALLNVSLIASAYFLHPYVQTPELALAWGVLIAGVAQLLFQLPLLAKHRLLVVPVWGYAVGERGSKVHEGVSRIKTLMIPALFAVSVSQINLLLDTLIATLLVASSVSWLYYSDRLMELPLGIFGVAIATVVLPNLSKKHVEKSPEQFSAVLDWAFRLVCIIAIPATLALLLLSEQLLIALFHGAKFTAYDVTQSAGSMRAYALGLLAFMSIKIFAPGYFSRQDTKTPVRIGIVAMVINMLLNFLLVFGFGLAHVGLALATSIAAFVNAGLLLGGLRKEKVFIFQSGWLVFLSRLLIANVAMVAFLLYFSGDWDTWLTMDKWQQAIRLVLLSVGGLLIYAFALVSSGLRWADISK